MKTVECEITLIVDENGDWAIGTSVESAAESYRDDVGGETADQGIRHVTLKVTVPLPSTIEKVVKVEEEQATVDVAVQ